MVILYCIRKWISTLWDKDRGYKSKRSTIRIFRENFAQDVDPAEAELMAIVQKPFNQSIFGEKSGPPAWKQLPTWYQISTSDHMIPPDVQRMFAKRMNATTISVNASHASYVSHPNEITELILNAAKGK